MNNKSVNTIGVIMDGNRRWAHKRKLSSVEGHRAGYEKLKEVFGWVQEAGVAHLIVYGFSTENWNRPKVEVDYLMELLRNALTNGLGDFKKKGGRIRIVGERERFPKDIQEAFDRVEKETQSGTHTLWFALSYGGRTEILDTVNRLIEGGGVVNEEGFSSALWTSGMPDPEIIIRTSGERRLSGFLPWQSVYSELFFIDTYWPDFSRKEFDAVIAEYSTRERRYGK